MLPKLESWIQTVDRARENGECLAKLAWLSRKLSHILDSQGWPGGFASTGPFIVGYMDFYANHRGYFFIKFNQPKMEINWTYGLEWKNIDKVGVSRWDESFFEDIEPEIEVITKSYDEIRKRFVNSAFKYKDLEYSNQKWFEGQGDIK